MEINSLEKSCNLCEASTQSAKQLLKFGLFILAVFTALAAIIDARQAIGNAFSDAWQAIQMTVTFGGRFWGAVATSVLAFCVFLWALATNSGLNDSCEKYKQRILMLIGLAFFGIAANASCVIYNFSFSGLNTFQATAFFAVWWVQLSTCIGLVIWFLEQTGLIEFLHQLRISK